MSSNSAQTLTGPQAQLILEEPLLRVPHELARKNHKSAQRNIERERESLLSSLKSAASQARLAAQLNSDSGSRNGHGAPLSPSESLDGMIKRMETLKRKLEALHTEEETIQRSTRARISHLHQMHMLVDTGHAKIDEWNQVRLKRLLTDYLLRLGYDKSAVAFARETGIEKLVDVQAFAQFSKVDRSLREGRTAEALAWCAENKAYLKKSNSSLEFELRLQQYIELVRSRQVSKLVEATAHAKKYLSSPADSKLAIHAAGLLAFPPDTDIEEYQKLYSSDRWTHLSGLFMRTHHSMLSLPTVPALHVALSAGLSALKTPSCHSIHGASSGNVTTSTSGNSVCPICSTELNELARSVPYANRTISTIESDPVVLPNGRIYGRERLMRLNEKMAGFSESWVDDGTVRDPMNPTEVFPWKDVRKVFVT